MLKQRLLTAAFLIFFVLLGVFVLPTPWMSLALSIVALIGAWEWTGLLKIKSNCRRIAYVSFIALLISFLSFGSPEEELLLMVFMLAVLWWVVATAWVLKYKGTQGLQQTDVVLGLVVGVVVIVPTWLALSYLHGFDERGPQFLFFMMLLVAVADSGAYFAGRRWGKHKLAVRVSPGKTIEGACGALVASTLVAMIGAQLLDLAVVDLLWFVPLCVVTVMVSIVGDLLESLFKRRAGVKDSGRILPGHGGVLDRIDSLTAASPLFALGLATFGGVA